MQRAWQLERACCLAPHFLQLPTGALYSCGSRWHPGLMTRELRGFCYHRQSSNVLNCRVGRSRARSASAATTSWVICVEGPTSKYTAAGGQAGRSARGKAPGCRRWRLHMASSHSDPVARVARGMHAHKYSGANPKQAQSPFVLEHSPIVQPLHASRAKPARSQAPFLPERAPT